jgi:serralysin
VEMLETTFHQDLNGDGVIGIPTTPAGPTSVQAATVDSMTLTLATPSAFSGQIISFGNGGTDQIDLRGANFGTMHSGFDGATGILSVNDGSTTTTLKFIGQYTPDSFHFASDGNGGTLIYSGPGSPQATGNSSQTSLVSVAGPDTFVFAPNFGQISFTNFTPSTDSITFSKSVFSSMDALLAAVHDDGAGNADVTDAAHDTITLQHVTTVQLLAHQSDFHLV